MAHENENERDLYMKAVTECAMYANARLTELVVKSSAKFNINSKYDIKEIAKDTEDIGAWSKVVCEWANLHLRQERAARNYFEYISDLKHTTSLAGPLDESKILTTFLEILKQDITLAYVDMPISRSFVVNSIGVLRKDTYTGRLFYEHCIPRECDAIKDITCTSDFEIIVGYRSYGKAEGDAILLIASQYQEAKVKIYLEAGVSDVVLSYVGTLFEPEHRKVLATSDWETKSASYSKGVVVPRATF